MTEIKVVASEQRLYLIEDGEVKKSYSVSTSRHGLGEREGSYQTPRGRLEVCEKIGDGEPAGTVFKGRKPTGRVITGPLEGEEAQEDWIASRILWLGGLEEGRNLGGDVDTKRRYIYIHGTPHVDRLGTAASEGCVRMADGDVIELYEILKVGTKVIIEN